MSNVLSVLGDPVDQGALDQLKRCLEHPSAKWGALNADHHLGYSMPIGGVIAYENAISPTGVGYDIGCGNLAVNTHMTMSDLESASAFDGCTDDNAVGHYMDKIYNDFKFGMGAQYESCVFPEDAVFQSPKWEREELAPLKDMAMKQFGTIGSGNHYIDLFKSDKGEIWIGVHFGSRGLGHKITTGYMNLMQGKPWDAKGGQGDMNDPGLVYLADSTIGKGYIEAMQLAGDYAWESREWVVSQIIEMLGCGKEAHGPHWVHNHHNYAWKETHFDTEVWVVRKGATPNFPAGIDGRLEGQRSFIGGSMGEKAVIVEALDSVKSRHTLFSTVHGAGRTMSRTAAAGKFIKQYDEKGKKKRTSLRDGKGALNYAGWKKQMELADVYLRGGDLDEAPGAYKNLEDVLIEQGMRETFTVKEILTPIGVAMAGPEDSPR